MSWQLQMCAILTVINLYIYFTSKPVKGSLLHTSLWMSFVVAAWIPVILVMGWE